MSLNRVERVRRSFAMGLIALVAWSALMPVLYRMDCLSSGRSVTSWFTPVNCPGTDVPAGDRPCITPNCCVFMSASVDQLLFNPDKTVPVPSVPELAWTPAVCVVPALGPLPTTGHFVDRGPPKARSTDLVFIGSLRI
ncbi:MAG: hypothetical protein IPG74_11065 [Flavobacteriales bacterium]|nr:hypothetical protein [Flavobacteriales bacterium]MBK7553732.1 hypothetical protein [Flavobacteriales bacterium]MBK9195596.1 hypothetical protein [Flavobacteriales bacterium]